MHRRRMTGRDVFDYLLASNPIALLIAFGLCWVASVALVELFTPYSPLDLLEQVASQMWRRVLDLLLGVGLGVTSAGQW